ncbi:response regulator transcription factor [Geodermatophilus aquaeductus]|uniref:Two component transcriptional regulator, LuxR family n=1 Tax=Geodermatophilus aquaeductus TaxID=1564161 RepID=A0A521DZ06_9ACTN|nr:response regulator transcription factor [Geodermatophilus aquaeductus]SMO76858.1 two component transcriptional regulator, LuxR family [Geodermatophilus aquaeductus]
MSRVSLLLVDDHALFTEGLRELLSFHRDLEVVGTAASAEEALSEVRRLTPDVVLMDLHLPGLDGATATRRITGQHPATAVLVLTMLEDDASVFAVLRAGARGYVLKGAHQAELVEAIRAVARGEAVFGAQVADRVLAHFSHPQPHRAVLPELTDRERQVLRLLSTGRPTQDIASQLGLSPKTVRNHLSNVFTKLCVADRAQAVLLARDAGLTED